MSGLIFINQNCISFMYFFFASFTNLINLVEHDLILVTLFIMFDRNNDVNLFAILQDLIRSLEQRNWTWFYFR